MNTPGVPLAYEMAKESYSRYGVSVEDVVQKLAGVSLSLHCWQGDDVAGFEFEDGQSSSSEIRVTGNYPGRARNVEELRSDLEKAFSLIPGRHRLNLHAMYGEFENKKIDRNRIEISHFLGWIEWATSRNLELDFNATCFSHPMAASGFTLSSKDRTIRNFWIEHVQRCRRISDYMGGQQKTPCIHNLWIPDGCKDMPVDRFTHRRLLKESLDGIFAQSYPPERMKDALESKLFGIGSEAFVVGSHEFYLGYGIKNNKMLCLDLGHFHPTESVADKVSSILQFSNELLLHISRGLRWDSDHVVVLNDEVRHLFEEIVRSEALERVHIALDFFDASINRIAAWVIGARATLQAILLALLQPGERLRQLEESGDLASRLALLEELKMMPFSGVWNYFCLKMGVPPEGEWMPEVKAYERAVLNNRD